MHSSREVSWLRILGVCAGVNGRLPNGLNLHQFHEQLYRMKAASPMAPCLYSLHLQLHLHQMQVLAAWILILFYSISVVELLVLNRVVLRRSAPLLQVMQQIPLRFLFLMQFFEICALQKPLQAFRRRFVGAVLSHQMLQKSLFLHLMLQLLR